MANLVANCATEVYHHSDGSVMESWQPEGAPRDEK
jgi:hypothetical protein